MQLVGIVPPEAGEAWKLKHVAGLLKRIGGVGCLVTAISAAGVVASTALSISMIACATLALFGTLGQESDGRWSGGSKKLQLVQCVTFATLGALTLAGLLPVSKMAVGYFGAIGASAAALVCVTCPCWIGSVIRRLEQEQGLYGN